MPWIWRLLVRETSLPPQASHVESLSQLQKISFLLLLLPLLVTVQQLHPWAVVALAGEKDEVQRWI